MPSKTPPYTPRQGAYLVFIRDYIAKYRVALAESDIARHFMVSGPSAHQMVVTLEQRGLISRIPGLARSIHLVVPLDLLPGAATSRDPVPDDLARLALGIVEAAEGELLLAGLSPAAARATANRIADAALARHRRPEVQD